MPIAGKWKCDNVVNMETKKLRKNFGPRLHCYYQASLRRTLVLLDILLSKVRQHNINNQYNQTNQVQILVQTIIYNHR